MYAIHAVNVGIVARNPSQDRFILFFIPAFSYVIFFSLVLLLVVSFINDDSKKNTIESKSRITAFAERILRCTTGDGLDSGIKYRQGTSKLDDRESKGSRKDSR